MFVQKGALISQREAKSWNIFDKTPLYRAPFTVNPNSTHLKPFSQFVWKYVHGSGCCIERDPLQKSLHIKFLASLAPVMAIGSHACVIQDNIKIMKLDGVYF
jgi:hypothetical protein